MKITDKSIKTGLGVACAALIGYGLYRLLKRGVVPPLESGTLRGFVADIETNVTIEGASVRMWPYGNEAGSPLYTGTTDYQGEYSIDGIAPGRYSVGVWYLDIERQTTVIDILPNQVYYFNWRIPL